MQKNNIFPTKVVGAGKFMFRMAAWSVCGKDPLPILLMVILSFHDLLSEQIWTGKRQRLPILYA